MLTLLSRSWRRFLMMFFVRLACLQAKCPPVTDGGGDKNCLRGHCITNERGINPVRWAMEMERKTVVPGNSTNPENRKGGKKGDFGVEGSMNVRVSRVCQASHGFDFACLCPWHSHIPSTTESSPSPTLLPTPTLQGTQNNKVATVSPS